MEDGQHPTRTALVTGASGVLGYWLVRALLDRGTAVVLLRRDPPRPSAVRLDGLDARCTVVPGDVLDAAVLDRGVGGHGVDTVFHLAAQSLVGGAGDTPVPTLETNVRGTWLLLDACRRHAVSRVLVASSARVYGTARTSPDEDAPLDAPGLYEASKAAADLVARAFAVSHGVPVAVARLTNVYGGGDLQPSRLVPGVIAAALAGRAPVIHSDGSPERDYLHGEDAAAALLALAAAVGAEPALGGAAFNVAAGRTTSVLEMTERVLAACGATVTADVRGATGPPDRRGADATRLRARTGWAPRVDLDDGLRRTVEWYRARPETLAP